MATVLQDRSLQNDQSLTLAERLLYPTDKLGTPKAPVLFALVALVLGTTLFSVYRWYQHTYSFSVGLDYFEPEFQTYWMNLLWSQLTIITLLGAIGVPFLWFTRPKDLSSLSPVRELSYYYLIFTVMAVASFFIVVILGVYVEADAAWHQVTIRDTDFTPTHIGLFYFAIPLGGVAVVLAFVWLHTRLPDFQNRVSIPLCLVASAPILIMPNLGLNEWGHTFFYAEELFAAPIHWGFVFLGWGLFGMAGFVLQCLARVKVLTKVMADEQKA